MSILQVFHLSSPINVLLLLALSSEMVHERFHRTKISNNLSENTPPGSCLLVYATAAATMLVPIIDFSFWPVFTAFLLLEGSLGMFNAGGGMLRAQYYPDRIQSSVMNVFRIVLNFLVVLGTKLTSWLGDDKAGLQKVFGVVGHFRDRRA